MSDALSGVRRALVIGLGRSGIPASEALLERGVEIVVADRSDDVDPPVTLVEGAELHLGATEQDTAALVDGVDLVVPSPGVPETSAPLRRALDRDVPVWSEPELGYRLAPRRVVAVTGTNGKTTVTELVVAMLTAADIGAVACGNIGHAFITAALSPGDEVLVAELSSFQLRFVDELHAEVAGITNLAPDHLDWHPDTRAYAAAKARLWRSQGPDDWAVGCIDDAAGADLVRTHAPGRIAWASAHEAPRVGVGPVDGAIRARLPAFEGELLPISALTSTAPHHVANVSTAACLALLAGAPSDAVSAAAAQHHPGHHRLELVAERAGIRFVDDSKATNPHAAIAALRAVERDGDVVWIAGGLAKGLDLTPLRGALDRVRHAVLIGAATDRFEDLLAPAGVPTTRAGSIEEAVEQAARIATTGDTVLLAPACASFDQFRDYVERGERFNAAVRRTTGEEVGARGG
jgi:UDP-N-acetylmuramoylalanine--D-glutamate ligase